MIMMIEMREKVAWTGSLAVAYEKHRIVSLT